MHEYVESSLPMFPTFTILHPITMCKVYFETFQSLQINEYSDYYVLVPFDPKPDFVIGRNLDSPMGALCPHNLRGFQLLILENTCHNVMLCNPD